MTTCLKYIERVVRPGGLCFKRRSVVDIGEDVLSMRAGVVLCPSSGEGEGVVGVALPGLFGREVTPGRGYFVQGGKVAKVQVPKVD